MDLAAASGHLEMVAWLHENRSEGCTVDAMAFAASKGQFEVLLFLHVNRSEGCNAKALVSAVCMEHIEIAQRLCEKYSECVGMNALRSLGSVMTPALLEQLALEL